MMMTKPKPEAKGAPAETASKTTAATPADAVADLERRLALLGGMNQPAPLSLSAPIQTEEKKTAPPPPAAPPVASASSGKNALLARIMAAQERAKQAQPKQAQQNDPPPAFDFAASPPPALSAPMAPTEMPPPVFDPMAIPPPSQAAPPPAFDSVENTLFAPPAAPPQLVEDPPPSYSMAPPAPSAPSFEDLLTGTPPAAPPAFDAMPPPAFDAMPPPAFDAMLPPPPQEQSHPQQFSEDFTGLEGLSEEEKAQILEEQRRIMEEIERKKSGDAASTLAARAEAFDQRSNAAVARIAAGEAPTRSRGMYSNNNAVMPSQAQRTVKLGENQEVPLHGQERTKDAIRKGTAIMVQCLSCQNWMQVTDNASLMFCPICQVVSPVEKESAVTSRDEAMQMEADRKMAEQLQREEYSAADREERRAQRTQRRAQQQQPSQASAAAAADQSWFSWLGLSSSPAPAPPATRQPEPNLEFAGAPAASSLTSVNTGAEEIVFSPQGEQERLVNRGGGGARVAQQKPLFSCVADSISTAASSITGMNIGDEEGNVHGVDSSSLLAVSNVSRDQGYQQYRD